MGYTWVLDSVSEFSLHEILMLQRHPSSPQSPVTEIQVRKMKNKNIDAVADHSNALPQGRYPSFWDISRDRTPQVCPPWCQSDFWVNDKKYDLVLAQPFSATFWWISSLVSLPTLGKELEGAKRSTATSLGGDEILRLRWFQGISEWGEVLKDYKVVCSDVRRAVQQTLPLSAPFPTILITIILINITIIIIIIMRKNTMRACSAGLERPLASPLFCWH